MSPARLQLTTLPAPRFRLALRAVFLATLGLSLVVLRSIAHAQAAPVAITPAAGVDWAFWGTLLLAIGTGLSLVLHPLAAKLHSARLEAVATEVDQLRGIVTGLTGRTPTVAITKPPGGVGTASMLVVLLLGALAAPALTGCTKAELGAAATSAEHTIINCTAQDLGTTPALDLATLVAVANVVAAERVKCTPAGGSLDWKCVETDLIAEGKVLGGCSLVALITGAGAATPPAAVALASPTPALPPGRVELEDFRARVAGGATFHTATGDL